MKRFESPFFMNFYFYDSNPVNTSKNASHISYIGERPGVVKNTNELELNDVMNEKSSDDLDFEVSPDSAAGHVQYAHERPRSHGLFSTEEVSNVKDIQTELSSHKGIVWRGILSLNEIDSIRLGFDNRQAWEDMMKSTVPLTAAQMGIPESNLRWVAAFHEEKGHPHVHLVMWEKKPKRRRGVLSSFERKEIRKTFMQEIYGDERVRLAQEKTVNRDIIRLIAKENLVDTVQLMRDIRAETKAVEMELKAAGGYRSVGVAPKLRLQANKDLANQLNELAVILPKKGRLAYKFMNDEVKIKIDSVADWILQQPAQKSHLDKYLKAVELMASQYTFQSDQIQNAKNKAYLDIRKRISQVIIKAASESQKNVTHARNTGESSNRISTIFSSDGITREIISTCALQYD